MIIFINGSFGSGKTTVAKRLVATLANTLLYDPEEVGFLLRATLSPIDPREDFQNYPLWRKLVPEVGRQLTEQYRRILVVPMTIWREDYFTEVADGFRAFDADFRHFCLTAPLETIHQRLRLRREQAEGDWVYSQTEKCVAAFQSPVFDERIDTVGKTPEEIAEYITARVS